MKKVFLFMLLFVVFVSLVVILRGGHVPSEQSEQRVEPENEIVSRTEYRAAYRSQKYRYETIIRTYENLLKSEPQPAIKKQLAQYYYELALLESKHEEPREAKHHLFRALQLQPQHAEAIRLSSQLADLSKSDDTTAP